MLHKFFGRLQPLTPCVKRGASPKPAASACSAEERSSALRIIHAGGATECYYMAVPASRIIDKYPSLVLARPEIFRRPWNSVVRPDEILIPGQKFFLVPRRTVKKLKRRSSKFGGESFSHSSSIAYSNFSGGLMASQQNDVVSSTGNKPGRKIKVRNRRVRFFGTDGNNKNNNNNSDKKTLNIEKVGREKRREERNSWSWQPSLTAIKEGILSDD